MNREIKFRAWDMVSNAMRIVNVISFKTNTIDAEPQEGTLESFDLYDVILSEKEFILMQYTGSKDMNSVEIYEGDILQNEHYFRYQVVFKDGCWRCEPLKNKGFKNRFIGSDLKVIGNIYENPELLKEDK